MSQSSGNQSQNITDLLDEYKQVQKANKKQKHLITKEGGLFHLNNSHNFIHPLLSQIEKQQKSDLNIILKVKSNSSLDLKMIKDWQNTNIQETQIILTKVFFKCQFIDLTYIYIWSTQVQSVEFLRYINAPSLQNVYLSNNKICNFKGLTKTHMPKLQILNIQSNFLKQLNFQRFKLPKLTQSLVLQFQDHGNVISQDLSKLMKLEPEFYDRIRIQSSYRIPQRQIRDKLKKKFLKKVNEESNENNAENNVENNAENNAENNTKSNAVQYKVIQLL